MASFFVSSLDSSEDWVRSVARREVSLDVEAMPFSPSVMGGGGIISIVSAGGVVVLEGV